MVDPCGHAQLTSTYERTFHPRVLVSSGRVQNRNLDKYGARMPLGCGRRIRKRRLAVACCA